MNTWRGSKTDDRWYLGVLCRACRAPILFALDRSDGNTVPPPAKLFLTCSEAGCGERGDYSKSAVKRYQKDK